ncbi:Alpha/Beta hydrolase protein [Aspergillus californicus]
MSPLEHQGQYGQVDLEFAQIPKNHPVFQIEVDSYIPETRKKIQELTKQYLEKSGPFPGTKQDSPIPFRDGYVSQSVLYKPAGATGSEPLIVWIHGGGFCLGSARDDEYLARILCQEFKCVVVSVEYRLAPEFPFPTAIDDCWDALKWIASNAASLPSNPSLGFIIAGMSAGANVSAVLSLLSRDAPLNPPLTGTYLNAPATVHHDAIPAKYAPYFKSRDEAINAPLIPRPIMDLFISSLNPQPSSALFSPLLWPTGHYDLPRTYFQVDGLDPLRDEGLVYEEVLRSEYGVETRIDVYPGVPHGFECVFPQLTLSRKFRKDQLDGFRWLLQASAHGNSSGV